MMSVVPPVTPVTMPAIVTDATLVRVDCYVACAVTFCVVPFEKFAVAVNCALAPAAGAVAVTVTDVTVGAAVVVLGDDVDEELLPLLHAHASSASPAALARSGPSTGSGAT